MGDQALSLQEDIAAKVTPWIRLLNLAVRASATVDIYDILARPDVSRLLEDGLAKALTLAEAALDTAWPPDSSLYRASLVTDIARATAGGAAVLRSAAIEGYLKSPEEMVRQAANAARRIGFRCQMSVDVAGVRRKGEKVLEEAEPGWEIKWVCRKLPNGQPDHRVCPWCRALDAMGPIPLGQEFPAGRDVDGRRAPRVYFNLRCPPRHPRCLPGGSLVSAESVTGASTRIYHGEMVSIRTLSGKFLRATPNHPVLTDHGWVPVGQLSEGDYVVSTSGEQRVFRSDQDNDDVPVTIQQVAETVLRSRSVLAAEVPVSPEDFHGDGGSSEVSIVGTYRGLPAEGEVAFGEHLREHVFQGTDVSLRSLDPLSDTAALLPCLLDSAYGSVSGSGSGLMLAGRELSLIEVRLLALCPEPDTSFAEISGYGVTASVSAFRQRFDALAGKVALDQVVEVVKDDSFHGPVYNLETECGWYIGSGIIVHNCRCGIILVRAGSPAIAGLPVSAVPDSLFISSQDIRNMRAGRYQALADFHRAALHELGQVIMKHRQAGKR